ncbi:MAG: DUF1489 family protein [Alphaproteobacteria bacterium]
MPVHLIKLAVGVDSVDALVDRQRQRREERVAAGGPDRIQVLTRNAPRRLDEALDGGSLYWVVKGSVLVRQRLLAIEQVSLGEGGRRTALVLDPDLVRTRPRRMRPFQGWRYLEAADVPPDLRRGESAEDTDEPPPAMAAELRELGLL